MKQPFSEINNIVLPSDTYTSTPPPAGFACLMLQGETVNANDCDIKIDNGKRNLFTRLDKAKDCKFPFVPTAFVVARNINIYNEFSSDEEAFLTRVNRGPPARAYAMVRFLLATKHPRP